MSWYKDWFDQAAYEVVYQARNDDDALKLIDLIEREVRPAKTSKVVDIACGRGRHALILARRGYQVTGIDLSPRAIKIAKERAKDEHLTINFKEGDMRESPCGGCYDGAVNLFTSFGYFDDENDHLKALEGMTDAILPGGWLVQDFLNMDWAEAGLIPEDERSEGDLKIHQRRWIEAGRLNKEITLSENGQKGTWRESIRMLRLPDFEKMYKSAGLEIVKIFGDYDGNDFSVETPRLILIARKR